MSKTCTKCKKVKDLSEFYKDKGRSDGLRSHCKECIRAYDADPVYRKRKAERQREHRQTEEAKKQRRIADRARVKSDHRKLTNALGRALNNFVRGSDTPRNRKLLGCTLAEFRAHIESQFDPWMNWDNRGLNTGEYNVTWQFDHIIPYKAFPTVEELEDYKYVVCHYTNVRPLCARKNNDERDQFDEEAKQELIRKHIIRDYLAELIG